MAPLAAPVVPEVNSTSLTSSGPMAAARAADWSGRTERDRPTNSAQVVARGSAGPSSSTTSRNSGRGPASPSMPR